MSNRSELVTRKRLIALGSEKLAEKLLQLAARDSVVGHQVEVLALSSEPDALKKSLLNRISTFKNEKRFLNYEDTLNYARELAVFLDDIDETILPMDAKFANQLLEKFLALNTKILSRCDDTGGEMTNVFRYACRLWLRSAKQAGPNPGYIQKIFDLYIEDPYRIYIELLEHANKLLSEFELRKLVNIFWKNWNKNADIEESYPFSIGLHTLARTIQDPDLYAKATQEFSAEITTMQKIDIAKVYLSMDRPKQALKWLSGYWPKRATLDRDKVLLKIYDKLEETEKVLSINKSLYERTFQVKYFINYLKLLPELEQRKAKKAAIAQAFRHKDRLRSIDFLVELEAFQEAEQLLFDNFDDLQDENHLFVERLAQKFVAHGNYLAASILHRYIIDLILSKGISRYYRHAVRHLVTLDTLAAKVKKWPPFIDHLQYVENLGTKHARKTAFWAKISECGLEFINAV